MLSLEKGQGDIRAAILRMGEEMNTLRHGEVVAKKAIEDLESELASRDATVNRLQKGMARLGDLAGAKADLEDMLKTKDEIIKDKDEMIKKLMAKKTEALKAPLSPSAYKSRSPPYASGSFFDRDVID